MDKKVKSKIAMYEAVKTVLQANQANWNSNVGFSDIFSEYSAKLQVLKQASLEQDHVLLGVSTAKKQLKSKTIEKAMVVTGALKAVAHTTNDPVLLEMIAISASDLEYTSALRFKHTVDRILEKANEHLAEIIPFGIDQVKVDELQALRENCELILGSTRQAIIDRKSFTETIRNQVRKIDRVLKLGLDTLMLPFRESAPDFYFHYKSARLIVDVKGKGSAPTEESEVPV